MNLDTRDTDLLKLHPTFRASVRQLQQMLQQANNPLRVFEGFRSPQRQRYLFQKQPRVTYADAWTSYHQFGLATDFVLYINGSWSWDTSGAREAYWQQYHQFGAQLGLQRLGFELPHLQLSGTGVRALGSGQYPPQGDETWAQNLTEAISSWSGPPNAPPAPSGFTRPPLDQLAAGFRASLAAAPGQSDWHSRGGIRSWRYDGSGVYIRDNNGQIEGPLRTQGEPSTCRNIWDLYRAPILEASATHSVSPQIVVMLIACETGIYVQDSFTGPRTFRWEPTVPVKDVPVPHDGDYSVGPMQILATTARWVIETQRLNYDTFATAPDFQTRPLPVPAILPLYDGRPNINIGTATVAQRRSSTEDDPILISAAYNAGGLYPAPANPWGLRVAGDYLDNAARWYGDACSVIANAS